MGVINHQQTWNLWKTAQQNSAYKIELDYCVNKIIENKDRYSAVGAKLNIPFYIIGCLHCREAAFKFNTFLANGDPLFNSDGNPMKTSHVPNGLGPFKTWEEAAQASILFRFPHVATMHWDIINAIENLCSWNGWGTLMWHDTNVPYVWSGTSHYIKGKYASDGQWDADLVDEQVGCASILLSLKQMGYDLNEIQPQGES